MNTINTISKRQDEQGLLQLQYCARYLYDTATVLNYVSWICCIAVTIILPFLSDTLGITKYLFAAVINTFALVIDYLANKCIKLGSAYKMRFDYSLFQFSDCSDYHGYTLDELKEKAAGIISRHKKSYIREITHSGTSKPRGVKEWYAYIPENIGHEEAVKRCQEQNGFFDNRILMFSWWVFISLIVIRIAGFIAVNHDRDVLRSSLIFLSGFALIKKVITEIYNYVRVYYTYVFTDWVKSESDLSLLLKQKVIDERRTRNVFATSLIYKILSYRLHSTIKAKDSILSEKEE